MSAYLILPLFCQPVCWICENKSRPIQLTCKRVLVALLPILKELVYLLAWNHLVYEVLRQDTLKDSRLEGFQSLEVGAEYQPFEFQSPVAFVASLSKEIHDPYPAEGIWCPFHQQPSFHQIASHHCMCPCCSVLFILSQHIECSNQSHLIVSVSVRGCA